MFSIIKTALFAITFVLYSKFALEAPASAVSPRARQRWIAFFRSSCVARTLSRSDKLRRYSALSKVKN